MGFRTKLFVELFNNNNICFHPLQVDNCDRNSRLVVHEDDYLRTLGLKRWNYEWLWGSWPLSTLSILSTLKTREVLPMLASCWANVVDGCPTINQHWVNVSSFPRHRTVTSPHRVNRPVSCQSFRHVPPHPVSWPWRHFTVFTCLITHNHPANHTLSINHLTSMSCRDPPFKPYSAEIFLYKPQDQIFFSIIINVSVSSFRFIWIPMLWVYGR